MEVTTQNQELISEGEEPSPALDTSGKNPIPTPVKTGEDPKEQVVERTESSK